MGPPRYLVIEEQDPPADPRESGVMLFRFDDKGDCVGDTWHKSIDEAKTAAAKEYGAFVNGWQYLQPEVKDVLAFYTVAKKYIVDFDPRVAAAARVVYESRMSLTPLVYENLDLIGRSEFDGIIERSLKAADAATKGMEPKWDTPHAIIEVRFRPYAEGGRKGPVLGPFYSCPFVVDAEYFECRLFCGDKSIELGRVYTLPVRFLNPELVIPKLSQGKTIALWEGKDVANGKVVEVLRSAPAPATSGTV